MRYPLLSRVVFGDPTFLSPGDPPGGGGGDGDDELEDPPKPPKTGNDAADTLLANYLEQSNAWLRRQRRTVATYRTRATKAEQDSTDAQRSTDDRVVLTGPELTEYKAYKTLGAAAELQQKLTAGQAAVEEVTTLKRDEVVRDAADSTGYNTIVLKDRLGNTPVEVREVDQSGTKVKVAFVRPEGKGEVELKKFAEENWQAYLPALTQQVEGQQDRSHEQQNTGPVHIPAQSTRTRPASPAQVGAAYTRSTYPGPPKRSTG